MQKGVSPLYMKTSPSKPCLAPLPEPLLRFAVAVAPALQAEAAPPPCPTTLPRSLISFLCSGSTHARRDASLCLGLCESTPAASGGARGVTGGKVEASNG
ncbi:hypothetical protein ACQJBY_062548 [Aegilops geniculata]